MFRVVSKKHFWQPWFRDLYAKLVARFSTSIPAKKNSTKLFDVTQQEDESTQAYLNRFNEEMLKMKKLLELVALKALIRGVKQHALYKKLYALLDKSLLKVKQVMENHIRVEEVSLLWYGSLCLYKDNQYERPFSNKIIFLIEMKPWR